MATAQPVRYNGHGFSLQRDKGRFVLPPQFRKTVKESSSGAALCLTKHDRWPCLTGFGRSRAEEFDAQLDREEELAVKAGKDFDRDLREFQLRGFAEIPFDDSGRFVLPPHLAELCAIDEQIYFHGSGSFIALFAPDALFTMGPGFETAQATCKQLQADALARASKP